MLVVLAARKVPSREHGLAAVAAECVAGEITDDGGAGYGRETGPWGEEVGGGERAGNYRDGFTGKDQAQEGGGLERDADKDYDQRPWPGAGEETFYCGDHLEDREYTKPRRAVSIRAAAPLIIKSDRTVIRTGAAIRSDRYFRRYRARA